MGRETLSGLRAKIADAMTENTLSAMRAKVAEAVGGAPVALGGGNWDFAVKEHMTEHGVSKADAIEALSKTADGRARYEFALGCDRIEADILAKQAQAKVTTVAAKIDKAWADATRNPPVGVSQLKHMDGFIRSHEGRALMHLRRFGELRPEEALKELQRERPTDFGESRQRDLGLDILQQWA